MKTVEKVGNTLIVKFKGIDFRECLSFVKTLTGRKWVPSRGVWEVPAIQNNIINLQNFGFQFSGEIRKSKQTYAYFEITNNLIYIKTNIDIMYDLKDYFSCDDYSYCYATGRFDPSRIVKRCFLQMKEDNCILPIGFLNRLLLYFEDNNIDYDFEEMRRKDIFNFSNEEIKNNLYYLELYDYQIEAVKVCLNEPNCIIKLPTSGGKTEIFLSLCTLMDKKTLILFSRIDLARQTLKRAKKAGLDAGIVQGDDIREDHQIVMCTVQSYHKLQNEYEMVIVDEVHRAQAKQYQEVLKDSQFLYRYGFSATPFIGTKKNVVKDMRVERWIGNIAYTLGADVLVDAKKIAKPIISIIDIPYPMGIQNISDYREIEKYGIIQNEFRNGKIKNICEEHKNVLVLVKRILHGDILQKLIPNSIFLYGDTEVNDRQEYIERFEAGDDIVIIASTIFDEGISINNIRNLIIASGGASPIKAIQRLGRGLRVKDDKKKVNVYDFMDLTNFMLERHSKSRIKVYKKEGFTEIIEAA